MRIIPAIDIIEGKCVRLSQGDYSKKTVYSSSPFEMAQRFEDHGINFLHLVDLDGAKSSKIINYKILEQIALKTALNVDFGGGLKSVEDVRIAFESGASQVTLGSIAVSDPDTFIELFQNYGSEKIILGADFLNNKIKTNGWLNDSGNDLMDFLDYHVSKGVKYVIPTDISKDGMLKGPSVDSYKNILKSFKDVCLIASGGISDIKDLEDLKEIGCEGAILGKAIYENKIELKSLMNFINT
ncbi:MAG TPA: 1-(5-phosphoribosyl)-5-[(5-phosphoribosylamino)methylideneamino]imidazole-4-carboxamide isomerase [Flavobacteriaceae bacterium]|jgi:phosphoribosylformimino-5-aminoimidazole carboxamide ribotide isomerase|nr:1-(5-phosphoribosyl)-5-[(5-phosphoribosylamino)methylideneamino]imidazole-4-carboxamide isomerase [Flavobacteriaceae bacterium]|tara:strand:- start:1402 stop:2124 length:723 start_codon:yes stop_codon:yes gene_type:complete